MFKKSLRIIIGLTCLGSVYANKIGIDSSDRPYLSSDLSAKLPDISKKNSMVYYGGGVNNILCPSVGLGWRYQKQKQAFDVYGSISSLLFITCVDINFSYLYGSRFYIGPGIGVGPVFGVAPFGASQTASGWMYTGKAICGVKITDKMFFQLEPNFTAIKGNDSSSEILPSLGMRLGYGF